MIKVATWNIRGLNDPLKQREVCSLVRDNHIACLALVETKVKDVNRGRVECGLMKGWRFFVNDGDDSFGRIWVCWDPTVVNVRIIASSTQIVHVSVVTLVDHINLFASFVYALNDHVGRRELWNNLKLQAPLFVDAPWVVLGDFNVVRSRNERQGGNLDWPTYMEEFGDTICHAGLEDLRYSGLFYSWHNARTQGHIMRKLDRALVNASWIATFEASSAVFLPYGVSDHSPVVVNVGLHMPKVRRPFKFFNHWVKYEEFFPIVEEVWARQVDGYAMFRIYQKLKMLKEALKVLSKTKGPNSLDKEKEVRAELSSLQSSLAASGGDPEVLVKERECLDRFYRASKEVECSLKQRSRIQWLKEGDSNSAFFFHSIKNRMNTNKIVQIQRQDGVVVTEKEQISEEIVGFYKELLGTEGNVSFHGMEEYVSPSVSEEHRERLEAGFTDEEIRDAMFSLHPNKAPGPDGFNAYFFQSTWHIVGPEIVTAVKEFFLSSKLLKESNATIVALIPKVPNASKVKDFRPISCCNTIYKCITKLLAGRLKLVLPSMVNEAQAAFVQGRSIGDNILLAQELVRGYHTSSLSSRCAIKVDLMKAYDSVSWGFIWEAMQLFGFPLRFIDWIRACVTTPRYSISINGELNGYFEGRKGLRQGDPISPYLFVLCMEVLSRLIAKKTEESSLFHYHWRCRKTKLTHLCFADDLILFCKGDVESISVLKDALRVFTLFSGLQPNPGKSEVFLSGVEVNEKMQILQLVGFSEGSLPVRYLGVPLISTKLRAADCRALVDRIVNRVKGWTSQFLSFAGRLQLLQAVLFSIQSYWCSHFVLPASIHKTIEGTLRAFLWKGISLNTHGAKVAWEDVARPKNEGGLGIKRTKDWNLACMSRFIWRLSSPGLSSFWADWVRVNLLNKQHFWVAKVPSNCSWTWRKLLGIRAKLRPFLSIEIGNGSKTSLWFDSWLPRGQICTSYQARVIYDSGLSLDAKVSGIISGNEWRWPVANSHELMELKEETGVLPAPCASREDKLVWRNGRKAFSTREAWEVFRNPHRLVPWFRVVWFKFHIPRHSFLLWLVVQRKLATQDRLRSWGLLDQMCCYLCQEPCEDHDHLFFGCGFSFRVWQTLLQQCGLQSSAQSLDDAFGLVSSKCRGNSLMSVLGKLSFAASVYVLWRERNRRKNENVRVNEVAVIRMIKDVVRFRLMSCEGFPWNDQNRHLMQQWSLPRSIFKC